MYALKEPLYTVAILTIGIVSAIANATLATYIDFDLNFAIPNAIILGTGAFVGLPIRFGRYLFESKFDNDQSLSLLSNPGLIAGFCTFFGCLLINFLAGVSTVAKTTGLGFFTALNQMDLSAITLDMSNRTPAWSLIWWAAVVYSGMTCSTMAKRYFDYKNRGFFN